MLYNVEFFRILFTISVIIYHFIRKMGYWNAAGYGMEFFFILSGVFLFRHITKNPNESCVHYVIQRIKKFFPYILLATLYRLAWALLLKESIDVSSVLNTLTFDPRLKNYTVMVAWYINILIWVSGFYFLLYRSCKIKVANLITLILIFGSYMACCEHNFICWEQLEPVLNIGILRGVLGIGTGLLLAQTFEKKKAGKVSMKYSLLEIVFFTLPLLQMFDKNFFYGPKFVFMSSAVLIYLLFVQRGCFSRFLNKRCFSKCGKFLIPIYLCQEIIITDLFPTILKYFEGDQITIILMTIGLVLYVGVVSYYLVMISKLLYQKCLSFGIKK